jgi:hypothetical protein
MTLECHYWGSAHRHPCPSGQTGIRAGLAEEEAGAGAPAAPVSPAPAPPTPSFPLSVPGKTRTPCSSQPDRSLRTVTCMSLTLYSFPQETP